MRQPYVNWSGSSRPLANDFTAVLRREPLPDLLGGYKGSHRCNALALYRGDCPQQREPGSIYCYYHDKVQRGLLEPFVNAYPVWPLPDYPWKPLEPQKEIA